MNILEVGLKKDTNLDNNLSKFIKHNIILFDFFFIFTNKKNIKK